MPVNIFIKVVEVLCTKNILGGAMEEKEDRQTPIL